MRRSNKKYLIIIATLIAFICICLPAIAFSKERAVIIGFHEKPGPSEQALIHGARGIIKRTYHLIPAMAASLPEEAIANIKQNPRVAYVEDDGIVMVVEPLQGDEYVNSWGVKHIGCEAVHESGIKGAEVKIAVIDTGIDYNHPDLDGNYWGGYDFVFNDFDPMDDSSISHGTHVAGIIAAEENGIGVVGVAPEAELYAVKVLDGAGIGFVSWVIAGIEWAVDNNMDIVNMSLAVSAADPEIISLPGACDNAYDAGVLLVAAAGNTYGGDVTYPAAYDSVIAVTGADTSDMLACFSPIGQAVELSAPGVEIISTSSYYDGYDSLSGTSQAAPHVAGTAALVISSGVEDMNNDGAVDNKDVRLKLQLTAVDLGEEGRDNEYGYGLVDAEAAVFTTTETQSMTITRTSGSPTSNARTVSLSGALYKIDIKNNDLSKVEVEVSEGGFVREDLSSSYRFGGRKPQEVAFDLDAGETTFDVTFIPYGKSGASADIIITKQSSE